MIKYSLIRKNFLLTKNYQELPESELEELADLGNVRRKALRLRVRRGGTAFYIHGAYSPDADIDYDTEADIDANPYINDEIAANIDADA